MWSAETRATYTDSTQRRAAGSSPALVPNPFAILLGISDPYKELSNPEVSAESDRESLAASVAKVMARLGETGYIA